jgi:uncharacterized repeat protein (TIGR03803 family)
MTSANSEWSSGAVRRFSTVAFALAAISIAQPAAATSHFKVLYRFQGGTDGAFPEGALIKDATGNLYGTTNDGGGKGLRNCSTPKYCGTVFRLAPDGTETVLHSFRGGDRDGANPRGSLIMDATGNLYGTTTYGGPSNSGCVFKLAPDGTETVLHFFTGGSADGALPQAGLLTDKTGNLYGVTYGGGADDYGTIFKIAADGTEAVLYFFTGGNDGRWPNSNLIKDSAGNLYGTTERGGGKGISVCGAGGCGTVFKLAPDGTETVLHAFRGSPNDGQTPTAGVIKDKADNLYGTTFGGATYGDGIVFKIAPDGTETMLYVFSGYPNDGSDPLDGVIMDTAGNLYGTTLAGGPSTDGTVFKLAPDGTETILHTFTGGGHSPNEPYAGLLKDKNGHLVGTTTNGDSNSLGTVFEIDR